MTDTGDDRAARLQRVARSVYCSWTPGDPSLRQLAALSGLQYHFVWRRYPDAEQARRATLEPWIRDIGLQAPATGTHGATLHDRALALARGLARYFASEDYRLMLYLVVRDERRFPWLNACYRRHVAAPVRRAVEELVRDYGRRSHCYAALRKGAAEQFCAALETHFALRALRPVADDPEADAEKLAQRHATELISAVDLLDLSHAA